jgi:hypothetical protein
MIEENKKAFASFAQDLSEDEIVIEDGKRYFNTNGLEKRWLRESQVEETVLLSPVTKCVKIVFDENTYVLLVGFDLNEDVVDDEVMQKEDLNAGLFTLVASDEIISISRSSNKLAFYDEIMVQHKDPDYKGHDYTELLPYMDSLDVYLLPVNSILWDANLERITCYILSLDNSNLTIEYSDSLLELYSDISLVGGNSISYSLMLNSLLSTNYKHSFLELYRIIERLFPLKYLIDFHEKSKSNLSFMEFSSTLEDVTNWRPKEDEALTKLFVEANEETISNYFVLPNVEIFNEGNESKGFYKLRNSIVHYRANHQEYSVSNDDWEKIIKGSLFLIDEYYSKYSRAL